MITMVHQKHLEYDADGNDVTIATLIVTTAAELPSPTSLYGFVLHEGSTATDASTGDKYALTSDGVWHKQGRDFGLNY